ncbi:MAG: hypothetical protein AAF697_07910 [Pseudomonadota bacterium]
MSQLNENGAFNQQKRELFLAHLAESSNVTRSAENADINPSTAYRARREDPEFARQWLAALYEGYIHLEMEVLRRLREGEMQAGDSARYDFANAVRLLAAHRDNAARAHAEQRNVSAAEVRASIDRKVKALREQVKAERLRASSRSNPPRGRSK